MEANNTVEAWKSNVRSWFKTRVHGKEDYDIIAIAGNVVVELGGEWDQSDVEAAKADMIDHNIPVTGSRGTQQIRINGQQKVVQ
jgi:hypothetical protein